MRKILPALLFSILAVALIASAQSFNGAAFYGGGGSGGSFTAGGDLSGTSSSQTVIGINGTSLAGLATGLLRNTTSTGVPTIATATQILSACTGCAPLAAPVFTTSIKTPQLLTTTNCSAASSSGTVTCSAATAGQFSCDTGTSAGTCVIDTSAIAATSEVFVQPSSAATISGVTCNTTADTGLTAPRLASQTATTSFTINLGTFTVNPECFNFFIVNP